MSGRKGQQRIEVVDVPPSDFEAGAIYALELLRGRVQARVSEINEIEHGEAADAAGVRVMLNGARDLLSAVRSDFEHLLCVGLRAAEDSHQRAKEGA